MEDSFLYLLLMGYYCSAIYSIFSNLPFLLFQYSRKEIGSRRDADDLPVIFDIRRQLVKAISGL